MASASPSPALSNNSGETPSTGGVPGSPAVARTITNSMMTMSNNFNSGINSSKNLRGLNKPKCINCGNVARSRCPYQACKSCCAKAQNPCHIHVLKSSNPSVPDKVSSSSSALNDQHSNEISASGSAHRVNPLRQLSNNFSQFNNLHVPSRAKKALTRKEAYQINEWRFSKLKEYKDKNIEIENEAFDRYLLNIRLLEEVFAVNPKLGEAVTADDELRENSESTISNLKLKLKSDPIRTENIRDRTRFMVHSSLRKLKNETPTGIEEDEVANRPKKARYSSLLELEKKVGNARNAEDLKSCQLLKDQIFSQPERLSEQSEHFEDDKPEHKLGNSPLKWFRPVTINQEALGHIDAQFSSLEQIENL